MNVEGAAVERAARPHDHAALPRRLQPRHGAGRRPSASLIDCASACRCSATCARRRGSPALVVLARRPGPSCRRAAGAARPGRRRSCLAGAAHARDRADGARLRADRGHRQRLARAGAHRRLRRRALGRRRRLRGLRDRDDAGRLVGTGAARPLRPGAGAAGRPPRLAAVGRAAASSSAARRCSSASASCSGGWAPRSGFPVGMSAAADDPSAPPRRVSVVSTIGYAAFLAGPPLLGFVADQVGTLEALLVVAVLLVPPCSWCRCARPAGAGSRGRRGLPAGFPGEPGNPALQGVAMPWQAPGRPARCDGSGRGRRRLPRLFSATLAPRRGPTARRPAPGWRGGRG